jgi:hypothetical protein
MNVFEFMLFYFDFVSFISNFFDLFRIFSNVECFDAISAQTIYTNNADRSPRTPSLAF